MAYRTEPHNISAYIPINIAREDELINFLKEAFHFPLYCGTNWNSLRDMFRSGEQWSAPEHVTIIHQDLPFLGKTKNGWFSLKIYLETLIECIIWLRENTQRELHVIFPSYTYEDIVATLTHLPVWMMAIGFHNRTLLTSIDPSWSLILQYMTYLGGVTAELCSLYREDVGHMTIHYLRRTGEYYIQYDVSSPNVSLMASTEENATFPTAVSFDLASSILETFFVDGERLSTISWSNLSDVSSDRRVAMLERLSYYDGEEEFLELGEGMVRDIVAQGMTDYLRKDGDGLDAFSIEYWQKILEKQISSSLERQTALCILGLGRLSDALLRILFFSNDSMKQECWISARFLGAMKDERAIPMLVDMLIDELPVSTKQSNLQAEGPSWYDSWRFYAPKLLRYWQTTDILLSLRHALEVWLQAKPLLDSNYDLGRLYEAELCYELGYREDFAFLATFSLEETHYRRLMMDMIRGYFVKWKQMTYNDECIQRMNFWSEYPAHEEAFLLLLCEKFKVTRFIANDIVKGYYRSNRINMDVAE
jgi:hypothetical protein